MTPANANFIGEVRSVVDQSVGVDAQVNLGPVVRDAIQDSPASIALSRNIEQRPDVPNGNASIGGNEVSLHLPLSSNSGHGTPIDGFILKTEGDSSIDNAEIVAQDDRQMSGDDNADTKRMITDLIADIPNLSDTNAAMAAQLASLMEENRRLKAELAAKRERDQSQPLPVVQYESLATQYAAPVTRDRAQVWNRSSLRRQALGNCANLAATPQTEDSIDLSHVYNPRIAAGWAAYNASEESTSPTPLPRDPASILSQRWNRSNTNVSLVARADNHGNSLNYENHVRVALQQAPCHQLLVALWSQTGIPPSVFEIVPELQDFHAELATAVLFDGNVPCNIRALIDQYPSRLEALRATLAARINDNEETITQMQTDHEREIKSLNEDHDAELRQWKATVHDQHRDWTDELKMNLNVSEDERHYLHSLLTARNRQVQTFRVLLSSLFGGPATPGQIARLRALLAGAGAQDADIDLTVTNPSFAATVIPVLRGLEPFVSNAAAYARAVAEIQAADNHFVENCVRGPWVRMQTAFLEVHAAYVDAEKRAKSSSVLVKAWERAWADTILQAGLLWEAQNGGRPVLWKAPGGGKA